MKTFNILSKARWLLLVALATFITSHAVADVTCTLSNANIIAGTTAATGYGNKSVTDGCSHTWTAYAIKNYHSNKTTDHEFLQIRAKNGSTLYWIAVPAYSGYTIKSITARVSSTSTTYNGGGNTATLYFSSSNSSTTASSGLSANPKTAVSGTGASSITLNCESLGLTSGYITASAGIRLWGDIVVTYKPACTALGTINGSVTLSQLATPNPTKLKATWSMNATTGIASYDLEVYNSSNVKVKTINNYTSGDEITGLDPCTTYYVKLYTVSSGSPYCDGGLIGTSSTCTTNGYTLTVTKSNVSLASGSEPSNICSNVSATYSAGVGYNLPTSITVTNAGAENTGWTWNSSTGALTINKANVTGNVTVTITGVAEGCSGKYTFAYGATANADGKNIDGATKLCFEQVSTTDEFQVTGFTIPTTTQYYWVGYNGSFYNDGLGTNNASSSRNQFKYLPVANLQGSSCGGTGDSYKHAAAGAYGLLRIYRNSSDDNLYVGFSPAGYQMRIGSGDSWTNVQLTQDGSTWTSDLVTLDAATVAKKYYINVWTGSSYSSSDAGVAINNWTDGNSTISSMVFKTGADTWNTTSGLSAGMRGKFRTWTDNCANNGYCHFVPYYRITYNGSGADGSTTASTDVSCEGNAAARTVQAAANGFTVPTGKSFGGWASSPENAAAGTVAYAAGADVVLTQSIVLYAIWTDIDYTVTVNQSPSIGATTTGQTSTAHYGGTINLTTTVPSGYRFDNWTTSDGFSITNNTSATTASFTMPAKNVTVTANFTQEATVVLSVAGSESTISGTRYAGGSYTLPSTAADCPDMGLYGWYKGEYEHATTAPSGANFYLPGATATLTGGENKFYAVYATITPDAANTYTKITTTGELVTGDYLLVAYYNSSYIEAMKNTVNASDYMDEVNVKNYVNNTTTPTKVTLESDNSAIRWRITKSSSTITIYNAAVSKYFCGSTGTPALNTTSEDFSYSVTSGDWALVTNSKTVYYSNQWYVGTPSSAKPIYLFKRDPSVAGPYTTSPSCVTHTLTVEADPVAGGTAEAAKTVLGETKTTTATATPNSHYDFAYWTISGTGSTMSNTSDGKSTDNPVTITMGTANATLTAHFTEKEKCTVVFKNNGTQVSSTTYWRGENPVAPTLTDGTSGDACDATSDKHFGWTQTAWSNTIASKSTIDAKTGAETVYAKATTLPAITAGDDGTTITYHAVWAEAIGVPSNKYQLVTNTNQLSIGDKIVIGSAASGSIYLLGKDTVTAANYEMRKCAQSGTFTVSSSKVTVSTLASSKTDRNNPFELTIGKSGDYWTFYDNVTGGYVCCASTSTMNRCGYEAELSDAGKWDISITSSLATITSQISNETTTRNQLRWNGSDLTGIFSCYAGTNSAPAIFRNLSTTGYQNFMTTCCDKNITIGTPSITGGGTVTFTLGGNAIAPGDEVETCSGAKDIVATVTPAAGYSCTALSFSGGSVSVDPTPGAGNYPSAPSAQNYTLSFGANTTSATLSTTATFTAKTASAWEWKYNGEEIPDPLVLYVGINKQLDVTYTPDDLLNTQKNYTVAKTDAHVAQGGKAYDHYTMRGAAGVTEVTNTTVTFTLSGLSKEVNVTVKPQPRVHFVDNIHGESFADVGPAVESYVATFIQPTPTHSDVSDPGVNYNSCERGHLHLLGWIESTWADEHPGATSAAITGAGSGKYYEAGASINVEDQNGKTFYAVWCVIE